MTDNTEPKGVQLVGSVPLNDSRAVFNLASSILGHHLHRIPDGETGERSNWIRWQFEVLANTPQLEAVTQAADGYGNTVTQVKLREGYTADQIEFGSLGYSAAKYAPSFLNYASKGSERL